MRTRDFPYLDRALSQRETAKERVNSLFHRVISLLCLFLVLLHSTAAAGVISANYTTSGAITDDISGGTVSGETLTNNLVSGGDIRINGAATVSLMTGGILAIGKAGIINSISGGDLTISAAATIGSISGGVVKAAGASSVVSLTGGVVTFSLVGATNTVGTLSGVGSIINYSNLQVSSGTHSGVISGNGLLEKVGAGTLTFSGNNTYTGGTKISMGILNINSANALGTGTVDFSGGSIDNTTGASFTLANNIQQVWNSNFTFFGTTSLNMGYGNITLQTTPTITVTGNTLYEGGSILTSSYGLMKAGTGTLVLMGNNAYSGTTTIAAGTLQIGNAWYDGRLSGLSSIVNNATLVFRREGSLVQGSDFGPVISGAGSIIKESGGSLTLNGNNSFSGNLSLQAGQLNLNSAGALGSGGSLLISGGSLDNTSGQTVTLSSVTPEVWKADVHFIGSSSLSLGSGDMTLTASRTIGVYNRTLTIGGVIRDGGMGYSLTKTGLGTLNLSGVNSYSGGTTISAGTLLLSGGSNRLSLTGNITTNGGGLNLGGYSQTTSGSILITAGSIQNGVLTSASSDFDARSGSVYAVLAGSVGLVKSGSGALSLFGNNTYSGATTMNGGVLNLNSALALSGGSFSFNSGVLDNTLGSAVSLSTGNAQFWNGDITFLGSNPLNLGSGTVSLSASRTVTVNGSVLTVAGAIRGDGFGLTKEGIGTLELSGVSSFTGPTSVNMGVLSVSGAGAMDPSTTVSIARDARFDYLPTTSGTLQLGALSLAAGSNLGVSFGGGLSISGNVTSSGIIGLSLSGNYVLGQSYTILTGSAGSSMDTAAYSVAGSSDFEFTLVSTPTSLSITPAAATPLAAIYWRGGLQPGFEKNWVISNWAANAAGTAITSRIPKSDTTVYLSSANALATNMDGMVLGKSLEIRGLVVTGSSAMSLLDPDAFLLTVGTGGLTVNQGAGTFRSEAVFVLGGSQTWSVNGGTFTSAGNVRLDTFSLTVGGSANTVVSGSVYGSGALVKTGAGSLTLSANNTYSGGTSLQNGVLNIASSGALGRGNSLLTISGGSINNTSGAFLALSANYSQQWSGDFGFTGSNSLNLGAGSVTFSAARTLTVSQNELTIGGTLMGSNNAFTKLGDGTLIFTSDNLHGYGSYYGTTTIGAGVLQLGDGGAAGKLNPNSPIINNGTLTFNRSDAIYQSSDFTYGAITGSGRIVQKGSGVLELNRQNTFSGGVVLESGTLNLNESGTLISSALGTGTLTINGGSLNSTYPWGPVRMETNNQQIWNGDFGFLGSQWLDLGSGAVQLGGSRVVNVLGNTLLVGGSISGTGYALTKRGQGTLILTGANTYTGSTTIEAGMLQLGISTSYGAPGASGSLNGSAALINNGVLRFYLSSTSTQGAQFGPVISGTGLVEQKGSGTVIFNGVNTYTGGTDIYAGQLSLSGGNNRLSTQGRISVLGGALDLGGNAQSTSGAILFDSGLTQNGVLTATGSDYNGRGGTVSAVLAGSYGLNKTTLGALTLSGNNTFSGGVTLSSGTLNLNSGGTGPTNSALGTGSFTIQGGDINNTSGSAKVIATNNTQSWNATISYLGGGNLDLGTGAVTMSGTRTASISSNVLSVGGVISGAGYGLTKTGYGVLELYGVNAYTGPTTVNAGGLWVSRAGRLNQNTALTVGRNSEFDFLPSAATATNIVTQTVSSLTLSGGSTIGLKWGSKIVSTGFASSSVGGVIGLNLIGIGNGATPDYVSGATYTLISGATGSSLDNSTYSILGSADFEFDLTKTPTALTITPRYVGPLTTAYWVGGVSGTAPKEWATTNWASNASGTSLSARVPASSTVINIAAANSIASNQVDMTISFNMSVLGLIVSSTSNTNLLDPSAFVLALGSTGLTLNPGAGAFSSNATILLSSNQSWSNNSNSALTLFGPVDLSSYSMAVGGAGPTVLSNSISGLGSISKTGSGTLTLSGTNSFTGGVSFASGVLNINNSAALGLPTLGSSSGVFVMSGGTIDNTSGGSLAVSGGNTQVFSGDVTFLGSNDLTLSTGSASLSGGSRTFNIVAGTLELPGAVGSGALVKSGTGLLVLSGNNTYAGGTMLEEGSLMIRGGLMNGTYQMSLGTTMELVANQQNTGAYGSASSFTGSGTLRLTGSIAFGNVYGPTFSVSMAMNPAGLICVTNNASVWGSYWTQGNWSANQASLQIDSGSTIDFQDNVSGGIKIDALIGGGTLKGGSSIFGNATLYLGVAGGSGLFSGIIKDSSSSLLLIKEGSGTQILTGANSYSGQTTINGGTLQIGNGGNTGSLAGSGGGTIVNSATLLFKRSYIVTQGLEFASLISGSGAVVQAGSAPLVLNGNNTFTGGVTMNSGMLFINASGTNTNNSAIGTGTLTIASGQLDNTFSSAITLQTNNPQVWSGDFSFIGTNALNIGTGPVVMSASRTLTIAASTLTIGGGVSGPGFSLTKDGVGTLVLGGASTYTGPTTISAGTLQLGEGGTTGSFASSTMTNNGVLVFYRSNTAPQGTDFPQTISGTGAVLQNGSGTTIFNTINTYTGGTTVNAGSLILSGGSLRLSTAGSITSNAGVLDLGGNLQETSGLVTVSGGTIQNGYLTSTGLSFEGLSGLVSAVLGGTYGLNKTTAGVLILSGSNTFSAGVNLYAGRLNLNNGGSGGASSALGTGTFSIGGGSFDNTSGSLVTISSNNPQIWNADLLFIGSNSLDLGSGSVDLAATRTVTVNASTLFVRGAILEKAGLSSLTKAGAGTLFLGGSNTFTGGITVNAGRLVLDNPSNLANSTVNRTFAVASGAYLQLSEAMKLGGISGATLTFNGAGTLEINARSGNFVSLDDGAGSVSIALTGAIDILSGTLRNGSLQGQNWSSNTASLNVASGAVFLPMDGSQVYINGLNGSGTVGGPANTATSTGLVIGVANGSGSFSGTILGVGGDIVKRGTGTQVLSGSSTYTGQTQIWDGILSVAYVNSVVGGWASSNMGTPADALHGTIALGSLTTTGQLTYTGPGETTDRLVNLAGTTGGGILNQAGTGLLKFLGRVSTTGVGDKTFTLTGSTTGIGEFSGDITDGPSGKVSLVKAGTGEWIISGSNSFTGNTTLSAGTLTIGNNFTLQNTVIDPSGFGTLSTLVGVDNPTIAGLAGSGHLLLSNSISSLYLAPAAGQSSTYSGVIVGGTDLALFKRGQGTQILSGANSYPGGSTVIEGTLILSGGNNRLSSAAPLTVTGGLLDLSGNSQSTSGTITFTGGTVQNGIITSTGTAFVGSGGSVAAVLAGTQGLNQQGPGTLVLSGSNTYSGGTNIRGGTLSLSGGSNRLSTAGSINAAGGALDLGGFSQTTSGSITLSGGSIQNGTLIPTGSPISAGSGWISAIIAGTQGLNMGGPGNLTLSAPNTFNGVTNLSGGSLTLGNDLAIQNSVLNLSGTTAVHLTPGSSSPVLAGLSGSGDFSPSSSAPSVTVTLRSTGSTSYSGSISGTNVSLVKSGTGTQTLTGVSNYAGSTSVQAGTLAVSGGGLLPSTTSLSVSTGARFDFLPTTPTQMNLNSLSIAGGSTLGLSFGSPLSTTNSAITSGTVSLALSGAFTSGNVYTLLAGGAGSSLGSTTFNLLAPVNFDYSLTLSSGSVQITPFTLTPLTDAYWLGARVAGSPHLWTSENWLKEPTTPVYTQQIPSAITLIHFNPSLVSNGDFLPMSLASNMSVRGVAITADTPFTLDASGGYTLTIGSYGIVVDSGSSQVSVAPTLALASAQTWTNNSAGSLGVSGTVNNAGYALTLDGSGFIRIDGVISGAGSLSKMGSGTTLLSGANVFSDGLTVGAGSLMLSGASNRLPSSVAITLTGGTLDLGTYTQNTNGTFVINGGRIQNGTLITNGPDIDARSGTVATVLSGSTGLNKTTSGTIILTAANTFSGPTSITGGSLILSGSGSLSPSTSLSVGGGAQLTFQPFSPGTLYVGALSLAHGGTISLEWGSQVSAIGSAILSGSFNLSFTGDYESEETYTILTGGPGSLLNAGTYVVNDATDFEYTLSISPTLVQITPIAMSPLAATYWVGGRNILNPRVWNSTNWAKDVTGLGTTNRIPGSVSTIYFAAANAQPANLLGMTLGGSLSVEGMVISTASPMSLLDSGTSILSVGSVGITVLPGAGQVALDSKISLTANQTWNNSGTNVLSFGGSISTGSYQLTFAGTSRVDVTGALSGGGTLRKTGSSLLTLQGANTYTGQTILDGGSMIAASGALAGSSAITLNAGSLVAVDYNGSAILSLSGPATAVISGAGLTLGAVNNSATSPTALSFTATSGTVSLASLDGPGATFFASNAAVAAGISTGSVTVSGTLVSDISGGEVSAAGLTANVLSGGSVNVSGEVAVGSLSGGLITVSGSAAIGILSGGTAVFSSSNTSIGTLLAGSVQNNGGMSVNSGTFAGILSGAGSLNTTGFLTLGGSLDGFSGGLTVASGGSLRVDSLLAGGNPLALQTGAQASFSQAVLSLGPVSNQGFLSFTNAAGSVSLSLLEGPGVTSFAGDLTIGICNSGTFLSTGVGQFTIASGSGGLVRSASHTIVETLAHTGFDLLEGAQLVISGGSSSAAITGTGALQKNGDATLTLSGASTFSMGTFVNAGTLNVLASGSLAQGSQMTIGLGATAKLDYADASFGAVENAGVLQFSAASGTVTVRTLSGDGQVTFASDAVVGLDSAFGGSADFRRNTTLTDGLQAGVVKVAGVATVQGTVSGGSLTLSGFGSNHIDALSGGQITLNTGADTSMGLITGGTLAIEADAVATSSSISNGDFFVKGLLNVGTLSGGDINNGGVINTSSGTFLGKMSGAGTFKVSGEFTLGGTLANYSGLLSVAQGGTLLVASSLQNRNSLNVSSEGAAVFSHADVRLSTVINTGKLSFTSPSGLVSLDSLSGGVGGVTSFSSDTNVTSLSSLGATHVLAGSLRVQNTSGTLGPLLVDLGANSTFSTSAMMESATVYGRATFADQSSIGSLSGAGAVSSAGTLTVNSGNFGGKLDLGGSLLKQSPGTLVLSGTMTQAIQSTIVQGGSLLLIATNVLPATGRLEVQGGALFAVVNGGGQTFHSIKVDDGATIGLDGFDGYILGDELDLGAAVYRLTPIQTRASPNGLVENKTKGSSQMLNGLGIKDAGANSFDKFTFDLTGQNSGAAVIGGTFYTRALVLSAASGGTLLMNSNADVSHVEVIDIGGSGSVGVVLDVGSFNAGTLMIGGAFQATGVNQTVNGNGTIKGNLHVGSGATLAPGNSPGILSTLGNVTVDPGGVLQFEYTANQTTAPGAGAYDQLLMGGSFRADGQVIAIAYDPLGNPRVADTKKHVLNVGTYGAGPNPNLNGSIPSYVNRGGTLFKSATIQASLNSDTYGLIQLVIQRSSMGAFGAGNINATGALLDAALSQTNSPLQKLIALIDSQSQPAGIEAVLAAINPAIYAELANLSFARTTALNNSLQARLDTLALDSLTEPQRSGMYAWSAAYGLNQVRQTEAALGAHGYTLNTGGNVSGVERKFGNATLGISGAMGVTGSTLGSNAGSVSAENWLSSLYGSIPLTGVVVDGAVGFGNAESKVRRPGNALASAGSTLRSSDSEMMAQVGLALPMSCGSLMITPSVRAFYSAYFQSAIRESGGGTGGMDADIAAQKFHSESLKTGIQAAKVLMFFRRPLRITASADWLRNLRGEERNTLDIGADGLPGITQKFVSSKAGLNSVRLGGGCELSLSSYSTLRIGLLHDSQTGQRSSSGNVSVGIEF